MSYYDNPRNQEGFRQLARANGLLAVQCVRDVERAANLDGALAKSQAIVSSGAARRWAEEAARFAFASLRRGGDSKSSAHAVAVALALSLLLPLAAHAAPQKAPRHTVKPLSSITIKVVEDQAFQRKAGEMGLVAGQSYVITAHDLDGCTAWVTERASDTAEYAAFKACRRAIDLAVDTAHAAAEKRARP